MIELKLLYLLLAIILFQYLPLSSSENLPSIYLTDDVKTAAYYISSLNDSYRIVLSGNITKTDRRLKRMGIPVRKVKISRDININGLTPRDLAYLLVYLHEINKPGILYNKSEVHSILSEMDGIIGSISKRRSKYAILFFSTDGVEYAILAAYAAILKGARMIDMDSIKVDPSSLKGVGYLIMITEPIVDYNSRRYERVLKIALNVDKDPFLDIPLGVITGTTIDTPFILLSGPTFERSISNKVVRGISLEDGLPLAHKIEYISSLYGYDSKIIHPDVSYSNVTSETSLSILSDAKGGIIYLNLHGNPYVMALKSDGYPIITSSLIEKTELDGSIAITLSCDTLRFSELESPEGSIAYSMLQAGAFAYIGSRKVEFSISSEAGTSYPDLITLMLMDGYSIGEAVMAVNNIHIKEFQKEGIENTEAAYEVVLGDPSLRISNKSMPLYRVGAIADNSYGIYLINSTPTVYIKLKILRETIKNVHVESKLPSTYYMWYSDDKGLFIYISTLSSSYSGYFPKGSKITVRISVYRQYVSLVPYLVVLLIITLSIGIMLRYRENQK